MRLPSRQCFHSLNIIMLSLFVAFLSRFGLTAPVSSAPKPDTVFRTPWTLHDGGYQRRWLVCGEFPGGKPGFAGDYLAEHGGEAAIVPEEGMTHRRPDGSLATWHGYASDSDSINLKHAFASRPATQVVGYAYTRIFRATAGQMTLLLGCDDALKVWVNGAMVYTHDAIKTRSLVEQSLTVSLLAGDNRILIKVSQDTGGWAFSFRAREIPRPLVSTPGHANYSYVLSPSIAHVRDAAPNTLVIHTDKKSVPAQTVTASVVAAGGTVLATATAPRGRAVAFPTAAWADGVYEIRCLARDDGGLPLTGHLLCYKGNASAAVAALLQAAATADQSTANGMHEAILGELMKYRLGEDAQITSENRQAVYGSLLEFEELQLRIAGKGSAWHPYGLVRLAYRDEIDDAPLFCRVYLPPGYDPAKRWPLVISLHGKNEENPPYGNYPGMDRHFDSMVDRYQMIMLYPYGRGNTFYQGIGDRDVLRCLALLKHYCAIDDDHVYLTGGSMGGAGTWYVGTHYPELFAALSPYFGGREYRVTADPKVQAGLSPRQLFRLERLKSVFTNAESLLTTPVFVNHGTLDKTVPVGISRYGVRLLQGWGYDVGYWEHPDLGHHSPTGAEDATMEWLLSHTRVAQPRIVRLRACDLRYASSHWLHAERQQDSGAFMLAEAEVFAPNSIRLDTSNILQVTLSPAAPLIDPAKPVRVIWNDIEQVVHLDANGSVRLRAPGNPPAPREKTPALGGPAEDIYLTPFAIVQGTISRDPAMRAKCQQVAKELADQWQENQHWKPRLFLDTAITPADTAAYSLILVGGSEENAVARQLAAQLPLTVTPDTITIDGKAFTQLHDSAVQMIHPHPLNPERYVAIVTATSPAGMDNAAKLEIDADYCLCDGIHSPWLATGYFDHAWHFDARYLE